jgi:hypothetical protein
LFQHPSFNFTLYVPISFSQILDRVILKVGTPYVFNCIAKVEAHVLSDLDALYSAWVRVVVRRAVDWI